uniref:Uncharacterized protein n=1 Tax=Octopus bimaculoides TaxID=37653 RepID=A0A0L8IAA7_OCTBM
MNRNKIRHYNDSRNSNEDNNKENPDGNKYDNLRPSNTTNENTKITVPCVRKRESDVRDTVDDGNNINTNDNSNDREDSCNNKVKNKTYKPQAKCNCRVPSKCPVSGNCCWTNVIYKCSVLMQNGKRKEYIGSSIDFKQRYGSHMS